ncbi:alpha/beta hydrolase [Micromonospora sp. DT81.3]|uniref:alpha/beta hydrolase n=1 Tax=Micromonospora sp. DT81.3 TaxID=3416523 RepID=UPI003CEFDCD2
MTADSSPRPYDAPMDPASAPPATAAQPAPRKRRARRVLAGVLGALGALILLLVVGFLVYAYVGVMGAEPDALGEVQENPDVTLTDAGPAWVLAPASGESETGLVFIPGAKVDAVAYASTLVGAVEEGATVVITKPTLNLAFFDFRPLSTFTELAPEVDEWFVGGHSLGGVRACQLAEGTAGLVLFASYCANDLSDSGLAALSISATEDGLSTTEKVDAAAGLLPADVIFVVIEGGNHAGFGAYGPQPGDGEATISAEEMRAQITDALAPFLLQQ